MPTTDPTDVAQAAGTALPYRLACLCDLRDDRGRVLLLRRKKSPNQGMCSPIGGKLDITLGESPAQCARREILEEAGLDLPLSRLHLIGLVSEQAYEGRGHWLLFVYRVLGPVRVEAVEMAEGSLEWFSPDQIDALPLPDSDRLVLWPMIRKAEAGWTDADWSRTGRLPGTFAAHIDCRGGKMLWQTEAERPAN